MFLKEPFIEDIDKGLFFDYLEPASGFYLKHWLSSFSVNVALFSVMPDDSQSRVRGESSTPLPNRGKTFSGEECACVVLIGFFVSVNVPFLVFGGFCECAAAGRNDSF